MDRRAQPGGFESVDRRRGVCDPVSAQVQARVMKVALEKRLGVELLEERKKLGGAMQDTIAQASGFLPENLSTKEGMVEDEMKAIYMGRFGSWRIPAALSYVTI